MPPIYIPPHEFTATEQLIFRRGHEAGQAEKAGLLVRCPMHGDRNQVVWQQGRAAAHAGHSCPEEFQSTVPVFGAFD